MRLYYITFNLLDAPPLGWVEGRPHTILMNEKNSPSAGFSDTTERSNDLNYSAFLCPNRGMTFRDNERMLRLMYLRHYHRSLGHEYLTDIKSRSKAMYHWAVNLRHLGQLQLKPVGLEGRDIELLREPLPPKIISCQDHMFNTELVPVSPLDYHQDPVHKTAKDSPHIHPSLAPEDCIKSSVHIDSPTRRRHSPRE